ncbi:variable large family protein [Borrelia persica]|uniref:variable large family protein n=1 Tax=Borrelia persica TaxID=44448 RepID=UPI0004676758|nr:variable large family protein [Borrelia persica]
MRGGIGKMKTIVKRSLLIIMILGMMGCGQQEQEPGKQNGVGSGLSGAMMEVGRSAENAFYAFIELVSDVLGFAAKTTTKKEDVGRYFGSLGGKLAEASQELEEVAKTSEAGVDKSGSSENPIREAIDTAKEVLGTLKGHLDLLGQVGDDKVVGEASTDAQGTTVDEAELKKAYNALKEIVKVATDTGVKALEVGATTLSINGVDNKDGAKILATGNKPGASDASKAAIILTAVSGEEMLSSIIKSGENDSVLGAAAKADTSAISFAKGGSDANLAQNAAKASAVAGGIALRSLVKNGKLASGAADGQAGGKEEVQKVGISAVNKLLVAVEEIIKKAVKNVIGEVKGKIDKARDSKGSPSEPNK